MNDVRMNAALAQMRAMAATAAQSKPAAETRPASADQFAGLLKSAIDSVNQVQQHAGALQTAFEKGDPKVSLAQAMIASQKASLSFQAMTQVRNKLLNAYQDIMNMPV